MIWISGPDKFCTYFNNAGSIFIYRLSLDPEKGNGLSEGFSHPE